MDYSTLPLSESTQISCPCGVSGANSSCQTPEQKLLHLTHDAGEQLTHKKQQNQQHVHQPQNSLQKPQPQQARFTEKVGTNRGKEPNHILNLFKAWRCKYFSKNVNFF